jgi:glycosyltransferase involved in cell wall biosynthesis
MKILYLHQYFKTPSEPGGTRSYWIAKKLVENGHEVTMITSSENLKTKKVIENIDGIKVIYLKVSYDQNMGIFSRLKSFINFMIKSTIQSFKVKNIDLVIATSTPLTIGFPALILKKIRKTPFIFEVRDLWPEVPIQMGALKNRFLIKVANWFESYIYKNAVHVVALSPGMADGVESKNIPISKISTIPNMAKIDEFWPRKIDQDLLVKMQLKKENFRVVHFGSLGIANGAMTIIESAKLLKNNNNIDFIFIGGGATETELQKECELFNLTNVHFLGKFPMKETSELVNLSDVSIVSFKDLPILYTNSPNKFFDSLSAGKPIIVNSAGWTKDLVEDYNCGFYVNPNKPEELVEKIVFLMNNPIIKSDMGINSRRLAEEKYDKTILCDFFLEVVENSLKN